MCIDFRGCSQLYLHSSTLLNKPKLSLIIFSYIWRVPRTFKDDEESSETTKYDQRLRTKRTTNNVQGQSRTAKDDEERLRTKDDQERPRTKQDQEARTTENQGRPRTKHDQGQIGTFKNNQVEPQATKDDEGRSGTTKWPRTTKDRRRQKKSKVK